MHASPSSPARANRRPPAAGAGAAAGRMGVGRRPLRVAPRPVRVGGRTLRARATRPRRGARATGAATDTSTAGTTADGTRTVDGPVCTMTPASITRRLVLLVGAGWLCACSPAPVNEPPPRTAPRGPDAGRCGAAAGATDRARRDRAERREAGATTKPAARDPRPGTHGAVAGPGSYPLPCGRPSALPAAQGKRIRPGALFVPVCVWQLLQSPDVCVAAIARSRPMYVTFALKRLSSAAVRELKLPDVPGVSVSVCPSGARGPRRARRSTRWRRCTD